MGEAAGSAPDLTFLRSMAVADTHARFERHRGRRPGFPFCLDGFSPDVLADARAASAAPGDLIPREAERLLRLQRSLGVDLRGSPVLTTDPGYFRITQWIFLQLFAKRLAVQVERESSVCVQCACACRRGAHAACPRCQGELRDRKTGGWEVDITRYGDRLLSDLEKVDWPEEARAMQRDLLGRCRGTEVTFPVSRTFELEYTDLSIFTRHVEMIFGVTFLLVDPYHPILETVTDPAYDEDLARYRERLRKGAEPEISGVRTGGFALNPANLLQIPILASPLANEPWSEGAIMAVPAHHAALFELARRAKLPIREVIHNEKARFDSHTRLEEPWLGDGVLTNSGPFTSLPVKVGRERILSLLGRKGVCQKSTRFRFKSLPVSQRRPWGPPVPIIHCKRCGPMPVPDADLPVEPPAWTPDLLAKGDEALGSVKEFTRARCPRCRQSAARDTQTLLPWLGKAWSFVRLALPELAGSVEGFRDLCPGAGEKDRPATSEAPGGSEPPETSAGPARDAVPAVGGAPAGASASVADPDADADADPVPADSFRTGSFPADEVEAADVYPEDVDVFGVPAGGESLEAGAEEDPILAPAPNGEPSVAAGESPEELPAAPDAGPDTDTGVDLPDSGTSDGKVIEPARPPRAADAKGRQGRSGRRAAADEPETITTQSVVADEDDEEAEDLAASLSPLDPFARARTEQLLPADAAIAGQPPGPKDLIGMRLVTKFLQDIGRLTVDEPFLRYRTVGEVRTAGAAGPAEAESGTDGRPGSVLPAPAPAGDPTAWIRRFGADALRLYLLFSSPSFRPVAMNPAGADRMRRFLDRIWRQMLLRREKGKFVSRRMLIEKHLLIHEVSRRISEGKIHTAVAALMSFVRFLEDPETAPEDMDRNAMSTFVILLSPFAPHLAEEIWSLMGSTGSLWDAPWPVPSDELIHPPEREYLIFLDGKLKDRMMQPSHLEPEKLESRALQRDRIREIVGIRKVEKVVVVPQRLVSIVLAK